MTPPVLGRLGCLAALTALVACSTTPATRTASGPDRTVPAGAPGPSAALSLSDGSGPGRSDPSPAGLSSGGAGDGGSPAAGSSSPASTAGTGAAPASGGGPDSATALPGTTGGTGTARATLAALPCPSAYAAPDPQRPVLSAALTVDGGRVTGTQRVVFTPDLATGELVFRLWAAAPRARAKGGSIDVTRVAVNATVRSAQRPSPTLLRIPLAGRTPAGRPVTIDLTWTMRLPTGANERLGARGTTAWFGSGLPLLAWARGRGWAQEPETANFAEATTSEAMRLQSLSVTRAAGLTVLATGEQVSDDGRTAVFRARSVRDVAVATGEFRTASVTAANGKQVLVGVAPGLKDDPATVARELARALGVHSRRFGTFPYERLVSAVIPDVKGGIEYPGAILLGTGQTADATASHEVAHEWWYGLVGGNQGRDPWLDESFATYAEALDRGTAQRYLSRTIPADGRNRVGAPMTYWEGRSSYYRSVYEQGAAMLLRARSAVGAAAFDSALTCHVRRSAHAVTTPADLAASFRHLPAVLDIFRRYGAIPR